MSSRISSPCTCYILHHYLHRFLSGVKHLLGLVSSAKAEPELVTNLHVVLVCRSGYPRLLSLLTPSDSWRTRTMFDALLIKRILAAQHNRPFHEPVLHIGAQEAVYKDS